MTYNIIATNTRWCPCQHSSDMHVKVKTVLVEGEVGDYAAYSGCGSDQWVAAYGNKIRFEEALIHFPLWS